MAQAPIRVLLAKLGLDTHTVGVTVIAHALRDAGMEVIFTGLKQTPEMVANTAIQEDVDVVGISSLSAGHMRNIPLLARLLREKAGGDKLLIVGGVIPEEDQAALREAGVARVFTMGADTREIIDYLNEWHGAQDRDAHS
ncbi:MAG: cobalamin B12-binding domain-containing protein [Gammaproteobacteria bacterium]|jgi:methylmalonyl-CoA mutase C-terminal domain/subunit|nr:cobalamin B12-binding domain-containing protein [Gammaproteobacteria bacterium]MBP6053513.1 cobalamin B12-binding domain-containing protein [Pseudomonadales bacterium]MBK6584622.1 cobalamin B12-binding domain-containing protein [Gammaproteobacteria bacterium]MBK7170924.1 cobalamin B12-binding domain-containing protein [Gammaproteobacteria bacterium]MBK7519869.1 cobalamin B12-binding domain-containing protein [Gammaproteobacteria bacterium]